MRIIHFICHFILAFIMEILKKAKKKQIENPLKYGEFYLQDSDYDFVCKKENGEHYTPAVIKYQTRDLIEKN